MFGGRPIITIRRKWYPCIWIEKNSKLTSLLLLEHANVRE